MAGSCTENTGTVYLNHVDCGTVTNVIFTWPIWNINYEQGNTSIQTWGDWNCVYGQTVVVTAPPWRSTEEQIGHFEEAIPAREIRAREEQVARDAALKKAEALLLATLTPAQRFQYERYGYFDTPINDKVYRIHKRSISHNVELVEGGKVIESLCCHLQDTHVPIFDHLLAQKLWLETDENGFRLQANIHKVAQIIY